jgi:hypothetical protein
MSGSSGVIPSRSTCPLQTFSTLLGYRALGVDYEEDGFVYDVIQDGAVLGGVISFSSCRASRCVHPKLLLTGPNMCSQAVSYPNCAVTQSMNCNACEDGGLALCQAR